jgi:hypothetical protein
VYPISSTSSRNVGCLSLLAIYWIKTTTDPGSGQTTGFSLLKVAR